MIVVRPVQKRDVDVVVALARRAEAGLTTLPKDRRLLAERVDRSCDSFSRSVAKPAGESYLLVGEDRGTGGIVGTSGIVSRLGGFEPFYAYDVRTVVHESKTLNVRREIQALYLIAEHDGPSEIGTLFVDPNERGAGHGALLSKARFLFMAEYRPAFASPVIAELRGMSDPHGRPPFWEAVGRHFFEIDFARADYMSAQDKKFIAELMPTHPIYIPLLPREAQRAIGQVHDKTGPALEILKQEGFLPSGKVDIFDAGPIVVCPLDRIRSVRESTRRRVQLTDELPADARTHVIASTPADRREFHACLGRLSVVDADSVRMGRCTAALLGVACGDFVRCVPLRAARER